jgi:tripartite-type tricarboxylate transporter receptor subunit TctC
MSAGEDATMQTRRVFLTSFAAAAFANVGRAAAQAYPSRSVRIVVTSAAGNAPDIIARLLGQRLSERLGQQFIVENRSGGGGNIGTEAVTRSPADGYTLLMIATNNAINTSLYDKLSFNFIRDIAPVASAVRSPNIMVVNPSVPVKTVPELIAYAKANPGKINMASSGNGTSPHVAGELFKMMTGVNMVHVPYRGAGPALADLLGGQVQAMIASTAATVAYIRSGTLHPLAVTTSTRLEVLPNIPTVGEFVPGYEASGWFGIGAPKNTPAEFVNKLNKEINAALAEPTIQARIADLGGMVLAGSPADFEKLIADETGKWAKVVKFAGIKAI